MRVAIIEGDGIGHEVIPPAREAIHIIRPDIEFFEVEAGFDRWQRSGERTTPSRTAAPKQAAEFVRLTGVDALAVAIGTSHGAYKFTRKPSGDVLKMDVIEEIHRRLPNTHLVMHGSSSVPRELVDMINKYGGKLKESYGVPVEQIQRASENSGAVKSMNSANIRMVFLSQLIHSFNTRRDQICHSSCHSISMRLLRK